MADQQAIQILKTISQSQLHGDLPPTALHQALTTTFGPPLPGSEADLAGAALSTTPPANKKSSGDDLYSTPRRQLNLFANC